MKDAEIICSYGANLSYTTGRAIDNLKVIYIRRKSDSRIFELENIKCRYANGILISKGGNSEFDEFGRLDITPAKEVFISHDDYEIEWDSIPSSNSDFII